MKSKSSLLFFIFLFSVLTTVVVDMVFSSEASAQSAEVAATVTLQSVSVSVSDGTVDYGVLATNSSAGTNGSDTQTATNNGNVTADLSIRGQDSADWTLETSAGEDQYVHRFCTSSCNSPTTNYTALTTDNQTLVENLAADATQTFDLYITTPTSSSAFDEQEVNVTVVASLAS